MKLVVVIVTPPLPRIASRKRGAWIETPTEGGGLACRSGIAYRKRGAWIETGMTQINNLRAMASPPGNGGRGLKQV